MKWHPSVTHFEAALFLIFLLANDPLPSKPPAWRLPLARFVTVEAQNESVRLARKSAAWNGLVDRYDIRCGDLRDPAVLREEERFDLILGSPPYFPLGTGVESTHPQKLACRFEVRGTVADYCRTAVRHLAPGGVFACVFPIRPDDQHQRVRDGAQAAGLTILRMRSVVLREGDAPLLGLFLMNRADDLPEDLRTAVTLREFDNLSYEEIAEVMDCPVGTVRSRIFRAREAIDNRIRPMLDGEG